MGLPTDVPNQVSAPLVYPKHRDNNWGHYMNKNFQHIAERTDILKIQVRDKAKSIELSVAKHFDNLKNAMNKAADEYNIAVGASRQNVMSKVKTDIDAQVTIATNKLYQVTLDQVAQIEDMKASLLLAITNIQSNFVTTEAYIAAGIDKIDKILDNEIEATAAGKINIVNKTRGVRELLLEHMSDYNNPHEFNGSQDSGAPVYQPDPSGTDAIFPLSEDDAIEITANEEEVSFNEDSTNIGGNSGLDTTLFNPLLQNLLGKYLVIGPKLDEPGPKTYDFYRFGHDSNIVEVGFNQDRAIQFGGSAAEVATDPFPTNPLLEAKLTWLQTDVSHNQGAFTIIVFPNDTPAEGDVIIINEYPENGIIGTTIPLTYKMIIARINYINKPTTIDEIFKFTPTGQKLELSTAFLQFDNATPGLFHWPLVNTALGQPVYQIKLLNNVDIHDFTGKEVEFDVPANLQDPVYLGNTTWAMVEAIAGTVDHQHVAVHMFDDGLLHLFFQPDSNGIAMAYTFQFADMNNPIDTVPFVNIVKYTWNTKTNNTPIGVAGTAKVVI